MANQSFQCLSTLFYEWLLSENALKLAANHLQMPLLVIYLDVCASLIDRHLCFYTQKMPRRLRSMNVQTVHAGLRSGRRQNNGKKIEAKRKGNVSPLLPPRSCCSSSMFAWCSHPQRRRSVKFVLAWPFHSAGTFTAPQYISKHLLSPLPVLSCIIFFHPATSKLFPCLFPLGEF